MPDREARPRRTACFRMLLSLLLLWCTSASIAPAYAGADNAAQTGESCGCCSPVSGTSEHLSSDLCNALVPTAVKDVTLPLDFCTNFAGPSPVFLVEWKDVGSRLRAASPPPSGPPPYLKQLRLLI